MMEEGEIKIEYNLENIGADLNGIEMQLARIADFLERSEKCGHE